MSEEKRTISRINEVHTPITDDTHSPRDTEDLLTTLRRWGLDLLDGESPLARLHLEEKRTEVRDLELDLNPTVSQVASDPVRLYLREMSASPLLTREGEVDIAKRIERGQLRTIRRLSRSSLVIRQVLAMSEDLKRGLRSIKQTVVFGVEENTKEILQDRVQDITRRIDELHNHYKTARRLAGQLASLPAKKKAREYRRCRYQLGREMVRISLIIRKLGLTNSEHKHLSDRMNKTADSMHSLYCQLSNLEKKIARTQ
jgi:RNA polymerase primary sigma factor